MPLPETSRRDPPALFTWKRATVHGRAAQFGVLGEGFPVLFLHGWALAQHAYRDTLRPLVDLGCRIYTPALPGFGGTQDLPRRHLHFSGYADWVEGFCEVVGLDEPAVVIGHSFGGGVGIAMAQRAPGRVRSLTLLNSVGGAWSHDGRTARPMSERPLWDWGLTFPSDVLAFAGGTTRILPALLEDAIPNAMRNPLGLLRIAMLASSADLAAELAEIRLRGTPVTAVHGDADAIIPHTSFAALCRELGIDGTVVRGAHSWPIADPTGFAAVMAPILERARAEQRHRHAGPLTCGATDVRGH